MDTCLQRYFKAHPNAHNPISKGMCPDEFGYLDEPENCNALHGLSEFPKLMSCEECWDREIPDETKKEEKDENMSNLIVGDEHAEHPDTDTYHAQTIDYKSEYERLSKIMSDQKDYRETIRKMEYDLECKSDLIEEQRILIDKMRTVIRCCEAFLGKDFLYA